MTSAETDARTLLRPAMSEFGRRVATVRDDQWRAPTPCTEWDVRALVRHVVCGNIMVPPMFEGVSMDDVPLPADPLGSDPVTAFSESAEHAAVALERDGALDGTVVHSLGEIPGEMLAYFRFTDHLIHAWDLARAIGADERLSPELVAYCWERSKPFGAMMAATGRFAEVVPVPGDAELQVQMLALHGRRV